jgi:hypothetical protein
MNSSRLRKPSWFVSKASQRSAAAVGSAWLAMNSFRLSFPSWFTSFLSNKAARSTAGRGGLYDIGSAYRCVVSNAFGATRSRPGILSSAGTSSVVSHAILGTWSHRHAGRDYTREFTNDGRCILRDGGQIGWIKTHTMVDDRTIIAEARYVHTLTGPDTLNIENVFTGKRTSK